VIDVRTHEAGGWRVLTLAPDFELLDLWQVPLAADPARGEDFAAFLAVFLAAGVGRPRYPVRVRSVGDALHAVRLAAAASLFSLRHFLGRIFRLDEGRTMPIPGRSESRVRMRLEAEDRRRDLGTLPSVVASAFEPVYVFENEALLEIANRTIHALLHLSWVPARAGRYDAVIAVYVKSRGVGSRAYLALIKPFRHWIVYPAWIAHLTRTWEALRPGRDAPTPQPSDLA
jgi:hypothetical protein